MNKFKLKPLIVVINSVFLFGCATTSIENANEQVSTTKIKSEKSYQEFKPVTEASKGVSSEINFGKINKNWVNPIPIKKSSLQEERASLPKDFKENVAITFAGRVSIVEILTELQRATKINFKINQDIYNSSTNNGKIITSASGTSSSASSSSASSATSTTSVDPSLGTNSAIPVYVSDFVSRSSLEKTLDLLAAKANINWKWNGGEIEIFRFETKTYNIAALNGTTTSSSAVSVQSESSGSSSSGGSGSSNSTGVAGTAAAGVTRNSTMASWDEIRAYILTLLSPNGSMAVLETAGIITVKDTPAVQAQVEQAIKELNSIIGRQIYMDINVYSVSATDEDNYAFNWDAAWANVSRGIGLAIANSAADITGASEITASITSGPFNGSNAVFQALSAIGKTSVENSFIISTLNGQPTPVGNNRRISFIESVSSTASTTVGVAPTVTVTPGAVYQGIGLSITPKIQKQNNKVLLEYSLNINDVESIKPFTTGSGASAQTVQLPTTTVKNILQRASLKSGQTLILSGFKQTTATIDKAGMGKPENIALGGRNIGKNTNQYLVITVTPYIAND